MRDLKGRIDKIVVLVLVSACLLVGCDDKTSDYTVSAGDIVIDTSALSDDSDNNSVLTSDVDIDIKTDTSDEELQEDEIVLQPEDDEKENTDAFEDEIVDDLEEVENLDEEENSEGDTTQDEQVNNITPVEVTPGSVEAVSLNPGWLYANFSMINTGSASLYRAAGDRKNIVIGVNAGHGTKGGTSIKTYCHPDMSPKVTGGTTSAGSVMAVAVSGGMSFLDGTKEASVTYKTAEILKNQLLAQGYDVLMLRDGDDVQLDNIARTVIGNNMANCIISLHWDGDNLSYDKGCFYISTPDGIKGMEPVASHWMQHEALGQALVSGLASSGCKIYKNGSMSIDLTQTSFSTVPSVDIELGNAASAHDDITLSILADGLTSGINAYFHQ